MSKGEKELGNAKYKEKRFDEALEHYSKAWELDPSDITILTNKAAVYFETAQYDDCIKTCEEAVERGREAHADYKIIAKAYARIGNAYTKMENLENAVKYFQKSLTEHRTSEILLRLREVEQFKEVKDREAYQSPQISEEKRNLGNEAFKKANYPEAVKHYTESIKRAEKDPRGYSNRAAAYMKLMALPEALKDSEKAIETDPSFIKAYIRKAAVQFNMREYLKSVQTCEDALLVDAESHAGKYRSELESQKQKSSMALNGYGGVDESSDGMTQEERQKKAMSNPKVVEIMSDPVMRQILEQMSTDPEAARSHLQNPLIREKIQVLANAGVIGVR